jgi:cytochrome c oxidase subunit 2
MQSAFNPASAQAHAIATLWWWMFGVGSVVWICVVVMMFLSLRGRRGVRGADDLSHTTPESRARIERTVKGALFVTVLILVGLLAFDFTVGRALAAAPTKMLTIEMIGHQWWWEIQYADPDPSKRLVTANELHVPVGRPVQFRFASRDVIHSFWAPNLHGKRDLIPGYSSSLWFVADTPGVYRGQCAEFCGLQHAKMGFVIHAEPKESFDRWLVASAASTPPPTDSTAAYGQRVFLSAGCSVCHTVGGTEARATVGPSLTHLKSRSTIAAGTLANTPENLGRWVLNPQMIKPGARMPPSPLSTVQLNALLAYLETLK